MATNVILPALGMAQDTGKIVEWLKAEGQHVTVGEALVVIETDKAAVDLEAPATGILAHVSAKAGEEVPVAQVIAVILSPEEAATDDGSAKQAPVGAASIQDHVSASASVSVSVASTPIATPVPAPANGTAGRRLASPKARRLAMERGVDLAAVSGSGPGGVVLADDVLAWAAGEPSVMMTATTSPSASEPATSTIWRLMAERTTQSWTTIPHFFLVREVTADGLITWRERAARETPEKVTYTDLLVKIVAAALQKHPRLNASWQPGFAQGALTRHAEINIGLAVAVEDGLVVPVIHQADDLTLAGIATRRAELVERAQAGKLRPRDLQDGTFTISNLGMYGIDAFSAIINAPQAAILAVGRIADRVVPVDGQPAVRPMMTLSLSCDHRVVDGARGAEFLSAVAALIEDPSSIME